MQSNQLTTSNTPTINLENSFIMLSHVNPMFLVKINNITDNMKKEISWFQPTSFPPHLTVAYSDQDKDQKIETGEIEKIKQESTAAITKLLDQKLKNSLFLLPVDIFISPNGWVFLELAEVRLESE